MSIDLTPVVGLDVFIEGESSSPATPPARTDESGLAVQSVRSSDLISISSALPAIEFDAVSGPAVVLSAASPLEIEGRRLIEPSHICRYLNTRSQQMLALYMMNISERELEVRQLDPINALKASSGALTTTQPPEIFAPGLGFMTVALSEFEALAEPGVCAAGAWHLLAAEHGFTCLPGALEPDVPLCEERGELPCISVEQSDLKWLKNRVRKYVARAKRLQRQLRARYPEANRGFNFDSDLQQSLARMEQTLGSVQAISSSCSQTNPQCRRVDFPKQQLLRSFKRSLGSRPQKGRKAFRKMRERLLALFGRNLTRFPDYLVSCE